MADLIVIVDKKDTQKATATYKTRTYSVNIGRTGVIPEAHKTEGDGKTPLGRYCFKQVFYRADKMDALDTNLKVTAITPDMGWCDDPDHPLYNTLITKPFTNSHEDMHREDHLYDIVIEISHNDDPPVPMRGSAVFLHLKRSSDAPTAGCVAFDLDDILELLKNIEPDDFIDIRLDEAA